MAGDTVFGEIALLGDKSMNKECIYWYNNKISKYYPNEIKSYGLIGSNRYVSKNINNTDVFLEYLIEGKINIYYLQNESGTHYYIEKESLGMEELTYKEELVKRPDGKEYLSRSTNHVHILNKYTADVPDMVKFQREIAKIRKPNHHDLIGIAKKYHEEVCPEEASTLFKQKSKTRIDIELTGGFTKYGTSVFNEQPAGGTNLMGGVHLYLWLPKDGNNFYIKTGVLFSSQEEMERKNTSMLGDYEYIKTGKKKVYYRIPLFLEYIFDKSDFIQPRIGIGLNFHQFNNIALGPSAGINIKLSQKFRLSLNYELDWTTKSFPDKICNQSYYAGLRYSL